MWELFKARTGAAAPLLTKIKLPGKQSWSHRLFPNAGESCAFCKSVSEFHQLFCSSTIWRPFAGVDLWTSPWSSSESDTFAWSEKPQKNDRTAWPLRQRQRHTFSGLHYRTDMSKLKPGAKAEGRGSSSNRCLSAAREIQHHTRRYICVSTCLFLPVWIHVMFFWEKVKILMFIVMIPAVEKLGVMSYLRLTKPAWLSSMHRHIKPQEGSKRKYVRLHFYGCNEKSFHYHFIINFFPSFFYFFFLINCGDVPRTTSPTILDISYTKGWID